MRSTVSYMLSHGSGEPTMSRPDYEQCAYHHGCLLVLLRGIGPSKPRSLQKIFEKVRRVNNVKISDSSGNIRDIWIRYIHDHPVENNDWGDFQPHRRLLGLVTIGKFDTQTELNELCRLHESLKVRYMVTLYDSRCILFGPQRTIVGGAVTAKTNDDSNHRDAIVGTPTSNAMETIIEDAADATIKKIIPRYLDEYETPQNFRSRAFFYRENDPCIDLEGHISEFVNALFWVLESKRLERSREKIDKVYLLLAPFEKKDFVGLDMESRNNRKRCVGRVTKNLADLSLQSGLITEALSLYHAACETLRAISDSLWVGAAEEGLCAASAILLYPQLREIETLHRNASLQEGCTSPRRGGGLLEKWRASDLTKKVITEHQNSYDQGQSSPAPHLTNSHITSNSSSSSSMSSMLTSSSSSSSSSSPSSTISPSGDGVNRIDLPANILKAEEIPITFRKAIINYSKYRHAAIIETEAALKAARICIEQNKNLDVAMFLQNILYINLNMSDQERIRRFDVITDLYEQIGYRRKAAFFQRMAALKHVQQGNQNPDWSQSYRLMLDSFPGYTLSLDPLEVIDNATGWPSLQIELLQSLITAARRLGHSALATRHMTFLLQTQWSNMSSTEQREMARQLQNLSAQCEGSPVPLVLENGTVIPPANLTDLPFCVELLVKDLSGHLRPHKIKVIKEDSGPFLFTPIHFSSIDRREKKEKNKIDFLWVQHDLSEITLKLCNPLPFELTVSDMRLLTTGIVFESLPQTISLQSNVPTLVTLHGTPIEIGQLEIQGYSTHTLGVKSNCRLKHMKNRNFPPNYIVDVIPALPRISVKTSLPQTATFSTLANSDSVITSASLTLYNGESTSCSITIINDSSLNVEHLEISITSNVDHDIQAKIFQIDENELKSKLPIAPHTAIDITVKIYGEADFISPVSQRAASIHSANDAGGGVGGGGVGGGGGGQSINYSHLSSGNASLLSRMSSPIQQQTGITRRNELSNSSFRSSNSGGNSSIALLSLPQASNGYSSQHIEAQFRIKYSGGEAMQEGFCRHCAISFNLELLPSAQITSWDVLPAEIPSQFYLVLDVSNLAAQEMSLNYTNNKSILIEAKESCRVPIPVDRCSLEETSFVDEIDTANMENKDYYMRSPVLSYSDSVSKYCSKHIAERVQINWMLTGTEVKGIALLRGIVFTPAMIDLVTVAPLQWSVKFENTPVQPHSEIVCTAGQKATLHVTISNQSAKPLKHLILTVKFYQDYMNGIENYGLETRVVMSGPDKTIIPLLPKNEESHFECSVLFFTPGRFKASIQCRSQTHSIIQSNAVHPLSHSCPIPESSNNQFDQHAIMSGVPTAASYHEQQAHIWKFIPPIEVTVVE